MKYLILGLLFVFPFAVNAETLTCPTGQKVESVLVTPAVIAVPAVTHTEVVIDTPAYTSCDNVGAPAGDYKNSSCSQVHHLWWMNVYKKVNHPAVTHEVVVIDVPEVVGTPAVYEDKCVTDTSYEPKPKTETKTETPTPRPGGRRHCGTINTPTCEEWVKTLGQSKLGGVKTQQEQLIDLLKQVLVILQKLQVVK